MYLFVKVARVDTKTNRRRVIGSLTVANKAEAMAFEQAISEIQTDKHQSYSAMTFARFHLPYAGKIDVPPDMLKDVIQELCEQANEMEKS